MTDRASRLARALRSLDGLSIGDGFMTVVGNRLRTLSQDTVPLALWCVRHHLDDFPAALWTAAGAFGDTDTLCAIVGDIVAMRDGGISIPEAWRRSREPLSTFTRFT